MNRLRNILVLGGFLLVAAAIAGVLEPGLGRGASPAGATITVSGSGTATAIPNQASFDFSVSADSSSAAAALSGMARHAHGIKAALEKAGLTPVDIQTTDLSLWPRTSRYGGIIGYTASESVQATAPIAKAGAVVDAAVSAGAKNAGGPNLTVSDESSVQDRALKAALADAKSKADTIAKTDGMTLGAVEHVRISTQPTQPYYLGHVAFDAAASSARIPIAPGSQKVAATVTVTYSAAG
jgi:uncharacterized protein YggE